MSGQVEYGTCCVCKKGGPMVRTYFRYDINCQCHGDKHFELAIHCAGCKPSEPVETKIIIKTSILKSITNVKESGKQNY